MGVFKVVASLPVFTSLTMEILFLPAVLLLFLSDSQLIRYVSVSEKRGEKHFSWPSGRDWLAGMTLVCILLLWALLPENIMCVRLHL